MLKSMRRRVILAAMMAFFAVIMLIAVLVNLVNYCVVTDRLDNTISELIGYEPPAPGRDNGGRPPEKPIMVLPDVESNYMMRFFAVNTDTEGNVVSVSTDFIASVNEESAADFARQALSRKSQRGYIGDYRYNKNVKEDGSAEIVFLNAGRERQFMKSLSLLTVAVSGGSLVLVFFLVVLFSGRAIKPIADNIQRQKQFITDAGHELKTPLTSISASLDVISMERGDDEWTDNIRNQIRRLTKLVGELVSLSRLDEESPLPAKEHFSLSNAAWEIAGVYQPQAKAHGKKFETDIEDDVTVFGDKASVQQMLSVLLDNAVRYSDDCGEIRLKVSGKRNKACIEVFNTCALKTIPDVNKLFDRFYRPDDSRSTETGGTGVGLAIAKAVAQAHGGSISASCPDGSTMTITVII